MPVTTLKKKAGSRGRKPGKANVITSSPYLKELETSIVTSAEKKLKATRRLTTDNNKKNNEKRNINEAGPSGLTLTKRQLRKRLPSSSSDGSNDAFELQDSSDDDLSNEVPAKSPDDDAACIFCYRYFSEDTSGEIWIQDTPEEKEEANRRGIELFQHLQVLPDRHTPKICPVCEVEMGTSSDRTRMLGWRYRCPIPPHHKREATVNTFLERVKLREVGAHTENEMENFINKENTVDEAENDWNETNGDGGAQDIVKEVPGIERTRKRGATKNNDELLDNANQAITKITSALSAANKKDEIEIFFQLCSTKLRKILDEDIRDEVEQNILQALRHGYMKYRNTM
ncbi:hypothetical protein RN001_003705 [Aquatica leii]|uniref:Uncharacterized protein n=1 Tax=Aquatica leii TaxID=1421715 RepID=A0AAN7Q6K7_9COLE|nr:hypothetical protein RN001_003705 [Aquatica leii]